MEEFDIGDYHREIGGEKIIVDKEWARLARLSGLSDERRPPMDDEICLYRLLWPVSSPKEHRSIRKQLTSAQKKFSDALEVLRKLRSDEAFFPCISSGRDGQLAMDERETESCRRRFDEIIQEAERHHTWFELALGRLHDARGPVGGRVSLKALIDALDRALSELDPPKVVSVSKKWDGEQNTFQFVWEVCQIAHRPFGTLSQRTVEKAIADYNTDRGLWIYSSKKTPRREDATGIGIIYDCPDVSGLMRSADLKADDGS